MDDLLVSFPVFLVFLASSSYRCFASIRDVNRPNQLYSAFTLPRPHVHFARQKKKSCNVLYFQQVRMSSIGA